MYAIVRSGGKQYRVEEGALVSVDTVAGKVGDTVTLGDILVIADGDDVKAGQPALDGAKVTAEIVAHGKGPKIQVLRYKNKTRQRRARGHRQSETTLRITKIEA
jgi:large subunit ribosomal protein L21